MVASGVAAYIGCRIGRTTLSIWLGDDSNSCAATETDVADDLKERGPADRTRVNINEPYEIVYWTQAFDCSEEDLRKAVAEVGVMADEVRAWVAK